MTECVHSSENLTPPEHSAENITIPSEWSCSNEAVNDYDRCLLHLSKKQREAKNVTKKEIQEFEKEKITSPDESSELIGARLPELLVSDSIITGASDDILDLRCSTISGELAFEDLNVDLPVMAKGCVIEDGICLSGSTFNKKVNFYGSRIKGASGSKAVTFHDEAVFSRVLCSYSLRIRYGSTFEQRATFSHLEIKSKDGTLDLQRIHSKGALHARDINVPSVDCKESIFEGTIGMGGAQIRDELVFTDAHFQAVARFGRSDSTQFNQPTEIEGKTKLDGILADQMISFNSVQFRDKVSLVDAEFNRSAEFSLISLCGDMDLTQATFGDELVLKPQYASSDSNHCVIICSNTEISAGTLTQAGHDASDKILYNFVNSTLGDVSFLVPNVSGAPHAIENYEYNKGNFAFIRFVKTKFDGFDFTSYREKFKNNWQIHRYSDDISESILSQSISPSDLELTYMYAKQGANQIGDNLASSKFFQHEMDHRLLRYKNSENNGFREKIRYLSLRLWGTINYTESSFRVFLFGSGMSFVVFPLLYLLISIPLDIDVPYPNAPFHTGYLIFSGESFISLVHSPGAQITSWPLRVLSVFEGFIRAFIIALFVFSLTRSVYR